MTSSQAPRITITPDEIEAKRSETPSRSGPATITIISGRTRRSRVNRALLLAALTLIPFVSSWAWIRRSRSCGLASRRLCVATSLLLGVMSCAAVFGAGIYMVMPKQDWIEAVNEAADRGVVLVAIEVRDGKRTGFSAGTGFVVAADDTHALIVTNKHVLGLKGSRRVNLGLNPTRCVLVLRSGAQIEGVVAGWHRSDDVDLALILAETGSLRPMGRIGRFEGIKIGDDVLAIGHPEGVLVFSFSRGTVERKWEGEMLQTSVPIGQGNSGGPLLDRKGRVIGVNTAMSSPEVGVPKAFSIRADLLLQPDQWQCCPDSRRLLGRIAAD